MADELPAPYGDEMKGISQATGVPLGMIQYIDLYSCTHCSFDFF